MNACQSKCPLMSMLKFTLPAIAVLIAVTFASCKPPADVSNNTPATNNGAGNNSVANNTTAETPTSKGNDHGPTVTLTSANFDALVLESDKPVLVDFWAPWCGPCVALAPAVSELATDYEGKVVVGKLNVDEAADIAQKYNITGIPALLVFKGGKVVDQTVGMQPKENLAKMLDKVAN